jgi:hypothetical protein
MADAFSAAWSMRLIDHADADVASQPSLAALERGCRRAAQRRLEQPVVAEGSPFATADLAAAGALRVQPPATGGVSIAYVIMGHRRFAHATITRLLHALWDPAHLFLLHLDARTNATAVDELSARLGAYANVHVLAQRRSVGWGAFSMVELLLDAIATALAAHPQLDFVINLSDADVALRTNHEVVSFLHGFRGRSFVGTKFPTADAFRYHAHAAMRQSVRARRTPTSGLPPRAQAACGLTRRLHCTAPHRTALHRTALHRTALHRCGSSATAMVSSSSTLPQLPSLVTSHAAAATRAPAQSSTARCPHTAHRRLEAPIHTLPFTPPVRTIPFTPSRSHPTVHIYRSHPFSQARCP